MDRVWYVWRIVPNRMDHPWTPTFASLTGSIFWRSTLVLIYVAIMTGSYVPGHTQIWHNTGGTSYDEKNQGDVPPWSFSILVYSIWDVLWLLLICASLDNSRKITTGKNDFTPSSRHSKLDTFSLIMSKYDMLSKSKLGIQTINCQDIWVLLKIHYLPASLLSKMQIHYLPAAPMPMARMSNVTILHYITKKLPHLHRNVANPLRKHAQNYHKSLVKTIPQW
jgi:hypothetical protein